jgi:IclR family pca regulon transcriptional regulator
MPPAKPKASEHFSSSLARGLAVIKAFDRQAPMLRIADVAERTGLDRATARRFLLTLLDLGYVGRSDDLFYLRPSALDIGFSYLASLDVNRIIQPFLNELTAVTRETSSFGILDSLDIRLLARSANNRMMNITVPLGTRVPAYSASIGRVLLAGLSPERFEVDLTALSVQMREAKAEFSGDQFRDIIEEVRRNGWATIEKSPGTGFCSIAVPIRDRDGGTIAGINVVEYPPRNTPQAMVRKYLRLLRDAAQQIEAALHVSQHAVLAMSDDPGGPPLIG